MTVRPIPLSLVRSKALDNADEHEKGGSEFPQSFGVLSDLGIPHQIYRTSEAACAASENFPFLPADVDATTPQGGKVVIDGAEYVVLENNQNVGVHEMTVARAELIDINN